MHLTLAAFDKLRGRRGTPRDDFKPLCGGDGKAANTWAVSQRWNPKGYEVTCPTCAKARATAAFEFGPR